jgi:beta-1,4-N-acetylglucosaminyltransferase
MNCVLTCSHGGHLTEMREITGAFEDCHLFFITYEGATTDELPDALRIPNLGEQPWRLPFAACRIYRFLDRVRPRVIASTGSEIALPVAYIGKLRFGAQIIHLECSAQVFQPSFTGRLIYPIADLFLVQWPSLLARYGPKARYEGGLI